jgi:hypothetical protein
MYVPLRPVTEIALLFHKYMMFVRHMKHPLSRRVTGIDTFHFYVFYVNINFAGTISKLRTWEQ